MYLDWDGMSMKQTKFQSFSIQKVLRLYYII